MRAAWRNSPDASSAAMTSSDDLGEEERPPASGDWSAPPGGRRERNVCGPLVAPPGAKARREKNAEPMEAVLGTASAAAEASREWASWMMEGVASVGGGLLGPNGDDGRVRRSRGPFSALGCLAEYESCDPECKPRTERRRHPALHEQRAEELLQELFFLHDLNGDGVLGEDELVQLNRKITMMHHGKDSDRSKTKDKYRELFRSKLDAEGQPVQYGVFRAYMYDVVRRFDNDGKAQEMILEQLIAEARMGREAFHIASMESISDAPFLENLSLPESSVFNDAAKTRQAMASVGPAKKAPRSHSFMEPVLEDGPPVLSPPRDDAPMASPPRTLSQVSRQDAFGLSSPDDKLAGILDFIGSDEPMKSASQDGSPEKLPMSLPNFDRTPGNTLAPIDVLDAGQETVDVSELCSETQLEASPSPAVRLLGHDGEVPHPGPGEAAVVTSQEDAGLTTHRVRAARDFSLHLCNGTCAERQSSHVVASDEVVVLQTAGGERGRAADVTHHTAHGVTLLLFESTSVIYPVGLTCGAVVVEIPWPGSVAEQQREVRRKIALLEQLEVELSSLWRCILEQEGLRQSVVKRKERLEADLSAKLGVFVRLDERLAEYYTTDDSNASPQALFDEVAQRLQNDEVLQHVTGGVMALRAEEGQCLAVPRGVSSIVRAYFGDPALLWDPGKDGDVTSRVKEALSSSSELSACADALGVHASQKSNRCLIVEVRVEELGPDAAEIAELRGMLLEDRILWDLIESFQSWADCRELELAGEREELSLVPSAVLRGRGWAALELEASALQAAKAEVLGQHLTVYNRESFRNDIAALTDSVEQRLASLRAGAEASGELWSSLCAAEELVSFAAEQREDAGLSLFSKGISLRQLLSFVEEHCHRDGDICLSSTTRDVVGAVILPSTKESHCCYADLLPGGPREPETLMSHCWDSSFVQLVRSVCHHASGRKRMDLVACSYSAEELNKTFWISVFALDLHSSCCHRMPVPCDCGAPKLRRGFRCQSDKLPIIMRCVKKHAVALDPKLQALSRAWVLGDLDEAARCGMTTLLCGISGQHTPDEHYAPPSLRHANAEVPAEAAALLAEASAREGGCESFDTRVASVVCGGLAELRVFWLAIRGERELVARELDERPELLEARLAHGSLGETLLQVAARCGYPHLATALLKRKAEVDGRSALGWTPLHYAASCINPERAAVMASMLLEARADPDAENSFGRTALEEAVCANPDLQGKVQILLDAKTSREPAPAYFQRAGAPADTAYFSADGSTVGFLPHPMDQVLFSHWKLRLDSALRPERMVQVAQPTGGEIQVFCAEAKPIDFGTMPGEQVPPDQGAIEVMMAAGRVEAYVKYHWPHWEFVSVVIRYADNGQPAPHYRVDLQAQTLMQIGCEHLPAAPGDERPDAGSSVLCSLRCLYP